MLWTRTERLNPLGCTSPTISETAMCSVAASTRSVTSTCQGPASEHSRAARFVTLPMAA